MMGFEGIICYTEAVKNKSVSASQIHVLFLRGDYLEILESTLDSTLGGAMRPEVLPWVIGALSFTGRTDEGLILYRQVTDQLSADGRAGARFFLAIGLCRQSQYADARALFGQNLRILKARAGRPAEARSAVSRFYAYQGLSFYRYFCGRLTGAERSAARALESAIVGEFSYGRVLASDLKAHVLIQTGRVAEGLALFEHCLGLARALGNGGVVDAIESSRCAYRAQFGLSPLTACLDLERRLQGLSPQDSYSQSNLLLELGRQLTLRGDHSGAKQALNRASRVIYQTRNRRQEVTLNLRFAHLSFRAGEPDAALNHVRSAAKSLDLRVDHGLELQVVGSELQIAVSLGLDDRARELRNRAEILSAYAGGVINQRIQRRVALAARTGDQLPEDILVVRAGEDRLGDILDLQTDSAHAAEWRDAVLEAGYLGLLAKELNPDGGEQCLYLDLMPGSVTLLDRGHVEHSSTGLTPILRQLASRLGAGPASKRELIETVWKYRYHPLRHDAVVYSAITNFRKLLHSRAKWLESTETGYRLQEGVTIRFPTRRRPVATEVIEAPQTAAPEIPLNLRQIKALNYLKSGESISSVEYKSRFKVSEITAVRDLAALTRLRLVIRVGRARATRYLLPLGESIGVPGGRAIETNHDF